MENVTEENIKKYYIYIYIPPVILKKVLNVALCKNIFVPF